MNGQERARRALAVKLEETLGADESATLLDHLPPFPWRQLATKEDIGRLERRLDGVDARFDGVDARFDGVDGTLGGLFGEFTELRQDVRLADERHARARAELLATFRGELITAGGPTPGLMVAIVTTTGAIAAVVVAALALLITLR